MAGSTILFHVAVFICLLKYSKENNNSSDREILSNSKQPVIRIKTQGLVRGKKSEDGPYYEFMGIPYATSTAANRFQSDLPIPTWEGIREADNDLNICPQIDDQGIPKPSQELYFKEDCLTLNVYTPSNGISHAEMAVMVYIHGGRFNTETCCGKFYYERFGPELFVKENIVFVHFHYRLGVFGFLCNEDVGNGGVKDVIAVLKWVRENIDAFGGDPKKVTLFGHSSGAPMVEMVMLSEQARGLIHGAISQSGSILSPWALSNNPGEIAHKIAKQFGYEGRENEKILQTLQNVHYKELPASLMHLPKNWFIIFPVTPCIEPKSNTDALIFSEPLDIIHRKDYNDIPFMTGFTKNEGLVFYNALTYTNHVNLLEREFLSTIPKKILQASLKHSSNTLKQVQQFYFKGKDIKSAHKSDIIDYLGDISYILPTIELVKSLSRSNRTEPMYLYEFAYDGGMAFFKKYANMTNIPGVCHADELGYQFKKLGVAPTSQDDELISQRLIKLWTNFAKFGNPTPETNELLPVKWDTAEDLKYLSINKIFEMEQNPFQDRIKFWDDLYRNLTNMIS